MSAIIANTPPPPRQTDHFCDFCNLKHYNPIRRQKDVAGITSQERLADAIYHKAADFFWGGEDYGLVQK